MKSEEKKLIEQLQSRLEIISKEKSDLEQSIQAYQRNLTRFQILYESSPVPYQSVNADAEIIEVNPAWLDKLGYEKNEVIGRWFGDFISESDLKIFPERFKKFKQTGKVENALFNMKCKDGSTIPVELTGIAHYENDQFVQSFCVFFDISKQAILTEQLRKEQVIKKSLLDASLESELLLDTDGNVLDINQIGAKRLKRKPSEIIGRNFMEFIPEPVAKKRMNIIQQAMQTKQPVLFEDNRDGILFDHYINPIVDANDKVNYIAVCSQDITQRKHEEESKKLSFDLLELTQKESHLDAFLERAIELLQDYSGCQSCAVRLIDEKGDIPYCASRGLSDAFIESENDLSVHRDQCMCINVFQGETQNKQHSFYTDHGTFFTNSLSTFDAADNLDELRETPQVCLKCGFETLALFPIRKGSMTIGLLQLADSHPNILPAYKIETLEKIALELTSIILRFQAEERELKQKEQLVDIAANVPGVIFEFQIDPDGSYSVPYMSEKGEELLDRPIEILKDPSHMFENLHLDDQESFERSIQDCCQQMTPWDHEFRIVLNSGDIRWIKGISSPRNMPDGSIRFSGFFCDITDRKNAQTQLIIEKSRSESYLNVAASIILALDLDGNITLINDNGAAILGRKKEECMGQNWFENFLPQSKISEVKSLFTEIVEESEPAHRVEGKILTSNGEEKVIRWHNSLIKNEKGDVVGTLSSGEDITEQYMLQQKLKESESRYRLLIENQNDLIVKFDLDYHLQYASPLYCQTFGLAEHEILGKNFFFLIHEQDRDRIRRSLETVKRPPFETEHEERVLTTDGIRWFSWKAKAVTDDQGGIQSIVSVGRDITEKKHAEIKMQQLLEDQKILLDNDPSFIIYKDRENNILRISETVAEMTGLPKEEIEGKPSAQIYPDMADKYYQDDLEVMQSGQSKLGIIEPLPTVQGQTKWLLTNKVPVKDDAGQVTGIIVFSSDITAQKQIEETLRASEKQFRTLSESSPVGVYRTDKNGHCIYANSRWLSMVNMTMEQAQGEGWKQALHPEDRQSISENWYKSVQSNGAWGYEYRFQASEDETFWVYGTANALYDENGNITGYIGVNVDITQRKAAEEKLNEALAETRQKEKEVAALLAASQAILQCVTYEQMSERIFDICKHLVGAQSGYIALLSEDQEENEVVHLDPGGRSCTVDPTLPMPIRGLRQQAYETGQAVYENNFWDSRWVQYMPPGHVELQNVLFAPLKFGEDTIGLMGLGNKPGGFTEHDKQICTAFGNVASLALRFVRNQESLKQSEERFRRYFELGLVGMAITSVEKGWLEFNETLCEMLGYSREELQKRTWEELSHPDDLAADLAQFDRVTRGEIDGYSLEKRFLHRDGSIIDTEVSVNAIRQPGGTVDYFLALIHDITEQKRSKDRLIEQERVLSDILEGALSGYWDWNVPANTEYLSPAFKEMFGYEDHELPNAPETWQRMIFPEDLETVMQVFDEHVKSHGEVPFYNEVRYRHRDGSTVWVICAGRVIEWAQDGSPIRVVGCHVDITKRKEIEQALKASEEALIRAQETAKIGSWEYDITTNRPQWTAEMYKIFDWDPRLGEQSWEDHRKSIHPDDWQRLDNAVKAAIEEGISYREQFRIIRHDQRIIWAETIGKAFPDDSGRIVKLAGTVQNITERKQYEQQLLDYQQELQHMTSKLTLTQEQERRQIATQLHDGLAQELVGSKIQLSSAIAQAHESKVKDILSQINNDLELIIDHVRNLTFDLSNPTLFEFGLATAIKEFLEETVRDRFGFLTELTVDRSDYSLICEEYSIVLFRIARELILNAVKHSKGHMIEVDVCQENGCVCIQVCDNGIGFDIEKIHLKNKGSKGLGLFSIKQQIEYYSGTFNITSSKNNGTTLSYSIPIKESHNVN